MQHTALAVQSARCAVLLRRRGFTSGFVTCEGHLPVVHGEGRCKVGRVALRGLTAPVELGARADAELVIGDRVFINQGASIVAAMRIQIEDDVRIGDYVAIYDSDHHPVEEGAAVNRAPVTVGRNAWLARGVTVLPGVAIGEHAVIAAGAVVTTNVEPRTLVGGNPARALRSLTAQDRWRRP